MTDAVLRCQRTSSFISGSVIESLLIPLPTPFETFPVSFGELEGWFDRRLAFDLPLPPRLPPLPRPRPPELIPFLDGFLPPDDPPGDDMLLLC